MRPEQQREYWNRRISSWDSSTYRRGGRKPAVEVLAGLFRANLRKRKALALDTIAQAAPRSLLELGCGTGELFASLPADSGVERYLGVDISAPAIARAQQRAAPMATFVESAILDLEPDDYREFDFVLGLGLLPYLTDEEVDRFTRIVRGKSFFFDFHIAGPSVRNALHWFYRRAAGHAFYRMHRDADVALLLQAQAIDAFELVHRSGLGLVRHIEPGDRGLCERTLQTDH